MKITDQEIKKIIKLCKRYKIENYTIKDDGTVDVDSDVNLNKKKLTELPLKFGIVTGFFKCSYNKLTSLKGAPTKVNFYFDCSYNKLTSLVGGPREVGLNFNCSNNQLTSLKGSPLIVKCNFYCYNNPKDNPKELEHPLTIIYGKFINI